MCAAMVANLRSKFSTLLLLNLREAQNMIRTKTCFLPREPSNLATPLQAGFGRRSNSFILTMQKHAGRNQEVDEMSQGTTN